MNLELVDTKTIGTGVVILTYQSVSHPPRETEAGL